MFDALTKVNPVWLVVALLVVGNLLVLVFGILVKFISAKWYNELTAIRRDLDGVGDDIENIKLLIANNYTTKEEVREIARSLLAEQQSNQFDRYSQHFWTRHEGDDVKEQLQALWRKVD